MSRATRLPPEERRRAILDATRPLLLQHGLATSTRQIAEACGIAEGTIFRVFESKQQLVNEVIAEEISVDPLLARLAPVADEADFTTMVVAVIGILQERARETRSLLALLQHPPVMRDANCRRPDQAEQGRRSVDTLTTLFERHADRLSVSPRVAAGAVLALSFGSSFAAASGGTPASAAAVADILLHGICKDTAC